MATPAPVAVTAAHLAAFDRSGYFVLPGVSFMCRNLHG
jgi:hypothetical protein